MRALVPLVLAAAVAFLGYRFARAFVPDAVAPPILKALTWAGGPVAYASAILFGPPELRAILVLLGLVAGLGFFLVERRRATEAAREADAKARQQGFRQQRKRLPPPAPPPTTRAPP